MYPLVRELAAVDAPLRVPVAVTCTVLVCVVALPARSLVTAVTT